MLNVPKQTDRAAVRELHRKLDRLVGHERLADGGAGRPFAFHRIVAALDDSPASRHVVAWARELAARFQADLWVITVLPPRSTYQGYADWTGVLPQDRPGLRERAHAQARRLLERATASRGKGPAGRPLLLEGEPVREIVRFAQKVRADLVILGSNSLGRVGRFFLGSVADGVKNRCAASVFIARGPPRTRHLVVPTDGSPQSRRAIGVASRLAHAWNAHATLLHAIDHPLFVRPEESTLRFEGAFGALATSRDRALDCHVAFMAPAKAILQAVRAGRTGLIVMGSRGLGRWSGAVGGSVSNRIAHEAPTSVLLVKDAREA